MNDPSTCRLLASVPILVLAGLASVAPAPASELNLLFMGDNGHHRSEARFQQLAPVLEQQGIALKYTDDMSDLNPRTLGQFDGLILYANIDHIEDEQAAAVLKYVAGGRGFIPLHCATYCWRNNADMVALMGAQFKTHGGRVFTTQRAASDHPITDGYGSFTSWDETYIHHRHNMTNRTVLEYRVEGEQADGQTREPWSWVRTHQKGRVFYTVLGHNDFIFWHPVALKHYLAGLQYALGDLAADATPSETDPAAAN